MPGTPVHVIKVDPPTRDISKAYNLKYNTVKLEAWTEYLHNTRDNVIFADCDMVMNRSATGAFDPDFDIAYTARTIIQRIPLNGGIIMVKPTKRSLNFFDTFLAINKKMYDNEQFHNRWRARYAGMNQAAFGYMLETEPVDIKLHRYETLKWNAVDCDWPYITDEMVFLHVKSKLRKNVLGKKKPYGNYAKAMKIWYREAGIEPVNPPDRERPARIKGRDRRVVRRRHV
jgi:hypothetical protein